MFAGLASISGDCIMSEPKKELHGGVFVEFAKRTLANLEVIEKIHCDQSNLDCADAKQLLEYNEVYEVTQLINSIMGLLIIPKSYIDKENIRKNPKDDGYVKICKKEDVCTIDKLIDYCKIDNLYPHFNGYDRNSYKPKCSTEKVIYEHNHHRHYDVNAVIRHIRNSCAHFNVEIISDENHIISKIIFADIDCYNMKFCDNCDKYYKDDCKFSSRKFTIEVPIKHINNGKTIYVLKELAIAIANAYINVFNDQNKKEFL